jgi:hypothetical protein
MNKWIFGKFFSDFMFFSDSLKFDNIQYFW